MADDATPVQGLVFGEVAEQYDRHRPGYPDAVFDEVVRFGRLAPGDTALEVGAGTGKATEGFVARGLAVHALEPSPGMARVLRAKGVDVEETTFESWPLRDGAYRVVYSAQAWHWVHAADRYDRAARALDAEGTLAVFWNKPREWTGVLGADNDAAYHTYAPDLTSSVGRWELDRTVDEMAAGGFRHVTPHSFTWVQRYTTAGYVGLLGTHSDHRVLGDERRRRLHDAVAGVIEAHGGEVDVVYDTLLYLATRP